MNNITKHLQWHMLVALVVATGFIWYAVLAESKDELTVAFLDVGQGDAILIETAQNQQILIDGGRNRAVLRELRKVMPFYDRSIDVVIATHPDADHIGGLPDVLERYEVATVIEPGVEADTAVYKAFERLIEEKNIQRILARRGMMLALGDGAYLLILFPDRDVSGVGSNDASVVAKLVYGKTSFLFTGDVSLKIEEYLVALDGRNLDVDVLKVGHHGSKTSTSKVFIGFTSPEYAVVSAGAGNSYGHPHKEVLTALEGFGVSILRTDLQGTIIMTSDGDDLEVVK